MLITAEQALAQYHRTYDNAAYRAACDAIGSLLADTEAAPITSVFDTADYSALANLLTDTALEVCGHPTYHGCGWTLAFKLHQCGTVRLDPAALQHTFAAVEAYLNLFREQVTDAETRLHNDATVRGLLHMEAALRLMEDSVGTMSTISSRNGRAAHHLTAACVGLLRTASLILKNSHSPDAYAAEKFNRSLRDLLYGLNELVVYPSLPRIFLTIREHLHNGVKEG